MKHTRDPRPRLEEVYVGLGSNLGDRARHLRHALRALARLPRTRLDAYSRVYESEPVGPPPQERYLNCAAALETVLSPRALLGHLLAIEEAEGRRRDGVRNRPRVLDLDLLLFGELRLREPDLIVPHPRLAERPFVLEPLRELAPERVPPGQTLSIDALARRVRDPVAAWVWSGSFEPLFDEQERSAPWPLPR